MILVEKRQRKAVRIVERPSQVWGLRGCFEVEGGQWMMMTEDGWKCHRMGDGEADDVVGSRLSRGSNGG